MALAITPFVHADKRRETSLLNFLPTIGELKSSQTMTAALSTTALTAVGSAVNSLFYLDFRGFTMGFNITHCIGKGLFPRVSRHIELTTFLNPLVSNRPVTQTHTFNRTKTLPNFTANNAQTLGLLLQSRVFSLIESIAKGYSGFHYYKPV
jgi:hypothetical protein